MDNYYRASLVCSPILACLVLHRLFFFSSSNRKLKVPIQSERVLIVGASSGVGEQLAKQYVTRGSRVAIVGRRISEVERVSGECRALRLSGASNQNDDTDTILSFPADFANEHQMVHVRDELEKVWGGIDTIHVCAGVSALRPLLDNAGYDPAKPQSSTTTSQGITHTLSVSTKALQGNFYGPMVVALTFIPLLIKSSNSPSIILLNSLASLIPAPTRSLYASTKASSLLLYQALAIEHPKISFSFIIPSTIEGSFRSSAVDNGPVRESDPNKSGLKKAYVAKACMDAADKGTKFIWMPWWMSIGHVLYLWWPSLIERQARIKYNFH